MKKYSVIFQPAAKMDLKEARAWYKSINVRLPARFKMDIKGIVEILKDRPAVFSRRYHDIRVAHLKVFPYAIHYLVEDQKVVILGVFHTSIDPGKWDERRYKPKEK